MTLRYDRDRQAISERAAATFGWLCTPGHEVSHLRAKIDLEIEDGLKGTSYEGDSRGGGDGSSPVERRVVGGHSKSCDGSDHCGCPANLQSDRACEALSDLDRGLELIAQGEALVHGIVNRFDPPTKRKPGDTDESRKPGKGKAPANCCQVCWSHGAETVREGDFSLWCNTCGRFKRTHGERPTNRALWEIIQRRGYVTSADLSKHAPHLHPDRKASA